MSSATPLAPDSPVTRLSGVGPKRAEALARLGIVTVEDLLRHAPRGYEDRGVPISVARAVGRPAGDFVVVRGRVAKRWLRRLGRRRSTLRVRLEDPTGVIDALWFNAPFLSDEVSPGAELALSGRVAKDGALLQPELARIAEGEDVPERLTGLRPTYPLADGVTRRLLQDLIEQALPLADALPDPLPEKVRRRFGLAPFAQAMRWAHRPADPEEAAAGRDRLLFDELLPLELAVKRRARERRRRAAPKPLRAGGGAGALVRALPFELSESQALAVEDAVSDLDAPCPMARMLAGEVGSGKTVVALAAVQEARSRGLQCALLAPTDLLARQHFRSFRALVPEDSRAVLLTGTLPAAEAREARERLAAGDADFVVGTHALMSEETRFRRLGLVVIDEQHRFGVDQRAALLGKARTPHCLVLTATPIPRTLALLGFGDCDFSSLDPRPGARGPVVTRVISPGRRDGELRKLRERLNAGEQAFFVTPRIEGDEGGAETLHRKLSAALAPASVALVHGRLPAAERDARVQAFRRGETAALVATTVIEVGLDVPGATLLWIEGAERLGLATLHQLRGRIARRG
ncbi:MAG TPA: DEAD/DEAH box helicase, partial [bacterium]|nr:DEAD/DEAH box helicase [bacterium]